MDTDIGQAGRGSGRRRGSRILFWHVLREFLLPLTCCLLAFAALFLFASVFDDLQDFLHRDGAAPPGSRWEIAWYFLLLQPENLLHVLPMSVLLASCYLISLMGRHHELGAVRAAGLHLGQLALPVWLVALLLCGASFWLGETVVPRCTTRASALLEAWTERPERSRQASTLVYRNAAGRRDWFFESFAADGRHGPVFIKQFTAADSIAWELRAAWACYESGGWVFGDGELTPFDAETQLPLDGDLRRFERCRVPELDETPERMVNQVRPAENLAIGAIRATLRANPDLPERVTQALRSTLWFRLSSCLACLIGACFGVALSITRERGSAMRGFAYAVGLMVAYYVVSQAGYALARRAYVPPLVGSSLPAAGFLVAGAVLLYRRR